ncbi:FadR/GntR family transcriptional regulator [Microlunatus sp. Y2014]|uniref:FadR/GntR family transcriptional regulator n=1 Tax=Microlunatus sp. Y2014 TaxID=3418488 RepID=UPI003DA742B5
MTESWKRAARPSVVALLQEYLVQSGARPGDRLPTEAEFARELGVGRSGVREAVQALQALGIVEVRHGSGTYLREGSLGGLGSALVFWSRLALNAEDPDDRGATLRLVSEVRIVLETSLVHEVMDLHSPETLAALSATVDEMAEFAQRGEFAPGPDREFHRILHAPLQNWVLDSIIASFWEAMQQMSEHVPLWGDASEIVAQHRAIVEALRERDRTKIDSAMQGHFRVMRAWTARDQPGD